MKNNLTILQLIYVIIKDRLKNTSFALSINSMKFYLTYISQGLSVISSGFFYALKIKMIYIVGDIRN